MAGARPVRTTALEYVLDVAYVTEVPEQTSDVRASLEVPYWTQDLLSFSYVFQPTEIAGERISIDGIQTS